jgi:hypothetical protein
VEVLIAFVIVALVALFVLAPLRAAEDGGVEVVATDDPVLADLEARKQAKYREIRDTEMDHAQGKLSDRDFRRQDAELRAEAIEILKRIDAHVGRSGGAPGEDG